MEDVTSADRPQRQRREAGPLGVIAMGLAVAAIIKELRLPSQQRTWHGSVARLVPYDFRMPTLVRVRDRLWSPESRQLITPTIFGVGWTLNLGRVVALISGGTSE